MYPNEAIWSYALRQNGALLLLGFLFLILFGQRMLKKDTRSRWGILLMIIATLIALTLTESWFEVGMNPFEVQFWSHLRPPLARLASDFPFSVFGVPLIYLGYVFWRKTLG